MVTPKEIWRISLADTEGHEQRGDRPAVVLAIHDGANVSMVIPFTSNLDYSRFPYSYRLNCSRENGLDCDSIVLVFQMRTIDNRRFLGRLGVVSQIDYDRIMLLVKGYLRIQ